MVDSERDSVADSVVDCVVDSVVDAVKESRSSSWCANPAFAIDALRDKSACCIPT